MLTGHSTFKAEVVGTKEQAWEGGGVCRVEEPVSLSTLSDSSEKEMGPCGQLFLHGNSIPRKVLKVTF